MHNNDKIMNQKILLKSRTISIDQDIILFNLFFDPNLYIYIQFIYDRGDDMIAARECVTLNHIRKIRVCDFLTTKIIYNVISKLSNLCLKKNGTILNFDNPDFQEFITKCNEDLSEELKKIIK